MKHECDNMPDYVEIKEIEDGHGKMEWNMHHLDGCWAPIDFCPFCGAKLDKENYAKKSAALVLSAHLDISEQGAEEIVNMIIEAAKHELRS